MIDLKNWMDFNCFTWYSWNRKEKDITDEKHTISQWFNTTKYIFLVSFWQKPEALEFSLTPSVKTAVSSKTSPQSDRSSHHSGLRTHRLAKRLPENTKRSNWACRRNWILDSSATAYCSRINSPWTYSTNPRECWNSWSRRQRSRFELRVLQRRQQNSRCSLQQRLQSIIVSDASDRFSTPGFFNPGVRIQLSHAKDDPVSHTNLWDRCNCLNSVNNYAN